VFLQEDDPEGDDCVSAVRRHRVIGHDGTDVLVSVILRGTDFEYGGG